MRPERGLRSAPACGDLSLGFRGRPTGRRSGSALTSPAGFVKLVSRGKCFSSFAGRLFRTPCRSGGIGRRAWFRSMYSQGCGGSSPPFGTKVHFLECLPRFESPVAFSVISISPVPVVRSVRWVESGARNEAFGAHLRFWSAFESGIEITAASQNLPLFHQPASTRL
jgi:hypothetical protein